MLKIVLFDPMAQADPGLAEDPVATLSVEPGITLVRLAGEADLEAWQAFVDSRPDAGSLHHAGWFRVLNTAFDVEPCYLLALDAAGAVRGILPAYYSHSLLAGRHLSSLEGGVLAEAQPVADAIVAEARALRDRRRAQYLQLRGGLVDDAAAVAVATVHTIISTDRPSEALWAAVKKKTRWAIRQTEKVGVTVEQDTGLGQLHDFYDVYAARMRDLGTPVVGWRAFDAMRTYLGVSRLRLYLVKYDNRPIGGMLCVVNGNRWTDLYAAAQVTEATEFANYLLYWHVIRDASALGVASLNLGRSTPDSGVHMFKRKWGGADVKIPYHFYPASDARPRDMGLQEMKLHKGLTQRVWSRLPLPIANRFGPLVRRQLPFI